MGERTGIGLVELAVLEALDGLGARPGRRHVKSSRVVAAVEDSIGLARGYGYEILVDLALPWKMPVPLVDGHGNYGSRGNDPPANPRYTEARLSPVGQLVLAAERGELAPVPVGLINGNTHRQGTRPPFQPHGIIAAIRRVIQNPAVTNAEVHDIVGPPDFMTGCAVSGDLAALQAGREAELLLRARVRVTDETGVLAEFPDTRHWGRPGRNRTVIVIDNFPPYLSVDDASLSIAERARPQDPHDRYAGLRAATRLRIREVRDESARGRYWLACFPDPDADADQVREQLLGIYGVFGRVRAAMPRPLAAMIRDWTGAHQSEDLLASLTALESAIPEGGSHDEF